MERNTEWQAFSTLKAGRDSAADTAYYLLIEFGHLSVPSKRVETLPPVENLDNDGNTDNFQYPQSGSRLCRTLSITCPSCQHVSFSTLKAGRDSAALSKNSTLAKSFCFQY